MKKTINLCEAPKAQLLLICDLEVAVVDQEVLDESPLSLHGLIPGQNIKILSNYPGQPLLIEVRNTYLAIDPILAQNIKVTLEN